MPPKQGGKSATRLLEINSKKGAGDRQPDRMEGMSWWEWSLGDECLWRSVIKPREKRPKYNIEWRWLPDISKAIIVSSEGPSSLKPTGVNGSVPVMHHYEGRAVHFLLGKDALCFHTKRSSSQNNSIPSVCPPTPNPPSLWQIGLKWRALRKGYASI